MKEQGEGQVFIVVVVSAAWLWRYVGNGTRVFIVHHVHVVFVHGRSVPVFLFVHVHAIRGSIFVYRHVHVRPFDHVHVARIVHDNDLNVYVIVVIVLY